VLAFSDNYIVADLDDSFLNI